MINEFDVKFINSIDDLITLTLKPKELYICENEGRILFCCPLANKNGCKLYPYLSCCILQNVNSPHWKYTYNDNKLTMFPSINLNRGNKCGIIHFWVKDNKIQWAENPICYLEKEEIKI